MVSGRGDAISGNEAGDLIRRNILLGDDRFPIEDPLAFRYGNVHVDGANGGMLYRFGSTSDAVDWIVRQLRLKEVEITTSDQLPLDFLAGTPRWWNPWQGDPPSYYFLAEEFPTGGERQLIVVFDAGESVIYVVEHFSDMPGI